MSLTIQIARCVWPGRVWDDRYTEGKQKVSASFVLEEDWTEWKTAADDKEKQFRVNVKVDEGSHPRTYPDDAKKLLKLKKGQTVSVVKMKAKHDYWLLVEYPESVKELMRAGLELQRMKQGVEDLQRSAENPPQSANKRQNGRTRSRAPHERQ